MCKRVPVGSVVNKLPANSGDLGSISGLGRSPGEGNGNPPQCSCLGNLMDRGAWWATVHGVTKELDMTEWLNNNKQVCNLTIHTPDSFSCLLMSSTSASEQWLQVITAQGHVLFFLLSQADWVTVQCKVRVAGPTFRKHTQFDFCEQRSWWLFGTFIYLLSHQSEATDSETKRILFSHS